MDEKQTPIKYQTTEDLKQLLQREGETMPAQQLLELLNELESRETGVFDADAAWQRFQIDYQTIEPEKQRTVGFWRRGLAAAAAVLVLVVGLSVAVGAVGGKDLWQMMVSWTDSAFTISVTPQQPETEEIPLDTFCGVVEGGTGEKGLVPTYIPDRYELSDMEKINNPDGAAYTVSYRCGEAYLGIHVEVYRPGETTVMEKDDTPVETYSADGVDYYIMENMGRMNVVWVKKGYKCHMNGDLTREELMEMLASVK